jgi:DNA ligase D-like protein (predicted ligase)
MLPIEAGMEPMLALIQPQLPRGPEWTYEPKWDGFRTIAYIDGGKVRLESRGAREMTRYFPELPPALLRLPGDRLVLDGEVIVVTAHGLDFDALLQRIHPAESRVRMLAEKTPAEYVAFDLLAIGEEDLRGRPLSERRSRLERLLEGVEPPVHLTPYTRDPDLGRRWLDEFEGAGLDGVIAKAWEQPYLPGKRGWVKVKHERTADCVVIGYKLDKTKSTLGALLLGLYDDEGKLHYVGHTSSFDAATKRKLLADLQPLRDGWEPFMEPGRMPGGPSRWRRGEELEWVGVRPEWVCEVSFDKLQSGLRFRHATGFRRWRPDKPPEQCRFDQIEQVPDYDVRAILATRPDPAPD